MNCEPIHNYLYTMTATNGTQVHESFTLLLSVSCLLLVWNLEPCSSRTIL